MLWLWLWLAAAAPIPSLAWELPYAACEALKGKKKRKKKKKKRDGGVSYRQYIIKSLFVHSGNLYILTDALDHSHLT